MAFGCCPLGLAVANAQVPSSSATCYVLVQDWPTRTCALHTDHCQNLTLEQADECYICSRGYGTYATMQDCLDQRPPATGGSSGHPSTLSPAPSNNATSPRLAASPPMSPSPSARVPSVGGSTINTCYVLVHDQPTRTCTLHTDNCQNLTLEQADECKMCSRGYGTYTTMQDCLDRRAPAAGGSSNPVNSPASSSPALPAPSPHPATSPESLAFSPPSPSSPSLSKPNPGASPLHKPPSPAASPPHRPPSYAAAPLHKPPSPAASPFPRPLNPTAAPLPRPPNPTAAPPRNPPSPKASPKASPSSRPPPPPAPSPPSAIPSNSPAALLSPLLAPPASIILPGTTPINSNACWVLLRPWPIRTCIYHVDDCRNLTLAEAEMCTLCSRGYGAYLSQGECEVPPVSIGPFNSTDMPAPPVGGGSTPTSVDPATFPSPALPTPSGCSASTQAWIWSRQADPSSPCPHWQPTWRWEDPGAWGSQGVPQQWTSVTLPSNTKIMITQCTFPSGSATFTSIWIPFGSQLILDDANLQLTVGTIYVQGTFSAGGPQCRLQSKISITFSPLPGVNVDDMGIQVLSIGQLDLHGALFTPTWTRLSATAWPGNNWVSLQDSVNWQPGQLVTVLTSIWRDEYTPQNEVMTISSVSSDGKTVVFTNSLQFTHYSGWEYQTEVALLSRNIVLQTSADVENTWRGGHVKIMGQGRLQGVMAYRMGQNNNIGRYPFHWHMLGSTNNQVNFANDCSVFRSFYRCFTIHGTSGMSLSNNVAFHVQGSCFYLEDGVEEYNWLEHNLAAYVHTIGDPAGGVSQTGSTSTQASNLAQPADSAAAGFYATNANNAFINNAASGGWAGFSFPCLDSPIGNFMWTYNISPCTRPLWQFTGNTVHSTAYFFNMAGGIYFGGKLWYDSKGTLYYSSGRYARDTKDDRGNQVFHILKNNKAWLAQWGISHWGGRVIVDQWQNHDCTRGANIFGDAQLSNAIVNGRSGNAWAQYPLSVWDLDPISGFRWYDTSVRTIVANVTFMNWDYQSSLPYAMRPSVWSSMEHSDEFKPSYISASANITYQNVDFRAFLRNYPALTGASRFFNWIDWDGSATQRGRPTVVGSYPSWWQLDSGCTVEPSSGSWLCDWLPWRTVARLDAHIDGYTSQAGTGTAVDPTPANFAGYVAQFGYRGSANRSMIITRNDGFSGVTGTGGWYVHFTQGATPFLRVWASQIPRGTAIIFATRYPSGTTFSVARNFQFFSSYNTYLTQVWTLSDMLAGQGESYYFDGKHLYIKMTDPGDSSITPPFTISNVTVWGTRYYSLSYDITATNLNWCPWAPAGGKFCPMQDAWDDIPDFLPSFNPWSTPYCWDVPSDPAYTCDQQKSWGKCNDAMMYNNLSPLAQPMGSYCAMTCGRCQAGQTYCIDNNPPNSGTYTCNQRLWNGECYGSFLRSNNWCARTCGFCVGNGQPPCIERVPPDGYTCAQRLSWGHCSQSWMINDHWCDVTCGRCKPCSDTIPSDGISCAQRKAWGNCYELWMVSGGYCNSTCGRC